MLFVLLFFVCVFDPPSPAQFCLVLDIIWQQQQKEWMTFKILHFYWREL